MAFPPISFSGRKEDAISFPFEHSITHYWTIVIHENKSIEFRSRRGDYTFNSDDFMWVIGREEGVLESTNDIMEKLQSGQYGIRKKTEVAHERISENDIRETIRVISAVLEWEWCNHYPELCHVGKLNNSTYLQMSRRCEKNHSTFPYPVIRNVNGWTLTMLENKNIAFRFGSSYYEFHRDKFFRFLTRVAPRLTTTEAELQRSDEHGYVIQKVGCSPRLLPCEVVRQGYDMVCAIQTAEYHRRFPWDIYMQGTFITYRAVGRGSRITIVHELETNINDLMRTVVTRLIVRRIQCVVNGGQCFGGVSNLPRSIYDTRPSIHDVDVAWMQMMPYYLGVKELTSRLIQTYELDLDPDYIMEWIEEANIAIEDIHEEIVFLVRRCQSFLYNTLSDDDVHDFCTCYMSSRIPQ